jgi:hypothetical protein
MFELPVSPTRCALAVGVPRTFDEFSADLADPGRWDFAASVVALLPRTARTAVEGWELYEPYARVFDRVVREVTRLGVTVVPAANPGTLTRLLREFPVVTLATHFRMAGVTPDDVRDPVRLADALREPADLVQAGLRAHCAEHDPGLLDTADSAPAAGLRERLAAALDAVVKAAHDQYLGSPGEPGPAAAPRPAPPDRLTRVAFEESLGPAVLREAPAVEFRDGLFTARAVVDAVPEDFAGVLDLGLCNSVILAGAVRRRRDRMRAVAGRWLLDSFVPFSRYTLVIQELALRPEPYLDALARVSAAVAATLQPE